jgi:hypothetical protein
MFTTFKMKRKLEDKERRSHFSPSKLSEKPLNDGKVKVSKSLVSFEFTFSTFLIFHVLSSPATSFCSLKIIKQSHLIFSIENHSLIFLYNSSALQLDQTQKCSVL